MGRTISLTPTELFRLDLACSPIREAFGSCPFLVGSTMEGGQFRDVDVRLMLDDEVYDRLILNSSVATLLNFSITSLLCQASGLRVDFQIQRRTEANAIHGGKPRNPLGLRDLAGWTGDAPVSR